MSDKILRLRDLHVGYGKVEALHGVTLDLQAGQIQTVIGPNGAGKSTMLNAIMGLLGGRGKIEFLGHSIVNLDVEQRVMRGMSLVPETRELFNSMSVTDNLLLGSYRRFRAREPHYSDQLEYVFELFPRLAERCKQLAGTLSGGERQMLAVGRALMAKPTLLMLDEPSLGLAPLIVKDIFRIIARLRETGVATLLIEQNARAALEVADYGYVLETGDMVLQGSAAELAKDPKVIATYLGLAKQKKT